MSSISVTTSCRRAAAALRAGAVIAYRTETVWGLGCDPQNEAALERLLAIKHRPADKGLIVLAAHVSQLQAFLAPMPNELWRKLQRPLRPPTTWIMPTKSTLSPLLTGNRRSLAVRLSSSQAVKNLSQQFGGALVSTSANLSGHPVLETPLDLQRQIPKLDLIFVTPGRSGTQSSKIIDPRTNQVLR